MVRCLLLWGGGIAKKGVMNIWGKIIGGAAGFALGGPIGGVVGAIAGHAVDLYAEDNHVEREAAFTIALIALSAKMAKADGVVTRDEILAFREKVDIAPDDLEKVGTLWDLAREPPMATPPMPARSRGCSGPRRRYSNSLWNCCSILPRQTARLKPRKSLSAGCSRHSRL